MYIDYHTHHERCGHASGTLTDIVEKAIKKGLDQIGLSDHSPLFMEPEDHANPGMTMAKSEFPSYVEEMVSIREKYKDRIDIRLGVESDYVEGWEEHYSAIYERYPLDYIIGSVHYFDGFHVYDPRRWDRSGIDVNEEYKKYFTLVQKAARSGMFDILGHIDAIKGLNYKPDQNQTMLMKETADCIAGNDVVVELNTSGLRKCREIFPSTEMLSLLHSRGVQFTFGSDAHSPEELGYGWEETVKVLKSIGVKEVATFKQRKKQMISLNSPLAVDSF
ncbi:histidinol-phosphatase HisJ family protein [Alteribacter natronophilus]|uniref:histidinol-phosphatase HisJ family protein n=1 Tax=Alteribacter natronophilus TaxID=2583810 RepID=UPI00110EDEC6|nr:histidinol-phosphatase HisJ family protein [Alteribacter natronophilus]TMW72740.1 histidinol-phosphatase HisJ family protein [Alteribacter natronophilus]